MSWVIVWDIETVPDTEGYARANGLVGQGEAEIRRAMGGKFPKPPYHSIVCIGAVVAEQVNGIWEVRSIDAPHVGQKSEKEIIKDFLDKIEELQPQLVTYNGSSFDFPVLRYRAMHHKLEAPGLFARPYFNRFTNDALDLCDALSSFGSSTKMKLDEICKFMGFEGKPDEINGSQVEDYFKAGKIEEIAEYCKSDVTNTYKLWLRWQLFCGNLEQRDCLKNT
jgi:predicted PolB exonuclease-like 3'-5' exonuclease